MATMIECMLDQADDLISRYPTSRAARRRAVSSAYYATFHALSECCADWVLPEEDETSETYEKVYRAIDHKPMKNAFRNQTALRQRPALLRIGETIIELQNARLSADYLPSGHKLFSLADAEEYMAKARLTVERIDRLTPADRTTLAIHLLFKDRPRD